MSSAVATAQPSAGRTFSKGLEGVTAAETRMSFIDGEKGVLEYVGIEIDALASLDLRRDHVSAVEHASAQEGGTGCVLR